MLRLVRRIHSCSGSGRELLGHTIRLLALIGALVLVQSHSLSALPSADEQLSSAENTAQTTTADTPQVLASQAAESSAAEATEPQAAQDVNLEFEVVPAELNGESKLRVQLDGDDTSTAVDGSDASVSDLGPGLHTARLFLMDGKDRPLHGGVATVHFRVHATNVGVSGKPAPVPPQELRGAEPGPPPIPDELRDDGDPHYSLRGSPLPLVSLIGFLLLIGGFLPTMRARKATTRIVHP